MATNSDRVSEIRVMLYPRDFELVKRFYAEVLQWEIRTEGSGLAMFEMGCATLELLSQENSHSKKGYLPVQGCGLSLRVPDVWGLWVELQSKVSILYPLRSSAWGDDSFGIADPEGFELIFFTDSRVAPKIL